MVQIVIGGCFSHYPTNSIVNHGHALSQLNAEEMLQPQHICKNTWKAIHITVMTQKTPTELKPRQRSTPPPPTLKTIFQRSRVKWKIQQVAVNANS